MRSKQLSKEEVVQLFMAERKRIIGDFRYMVSKSDEAIYKQRVKEIIDGNIDAISEDQVDQYCNIRSPRLPRGNWKLKAHPDLLLDLGKLGKNELNIFVAKKNI